jgi:hypothetical protein
VNSGVSKNKKRVAVWVQQYTTLEAELESALNADQRKRLCETFLQYGTGGQDNEAVAAALECSPRDLMLARGKLSVDKVMASGSALLHCVRF